MKGKLLLQKEKRKTGRNEFEEEKHLASAAFKTIIIYLLIGALWIVFSDTVVHQLFNDPKIITEIQTVKGWFFILITAILLFFLILRYTRQIHNSLLERKALLKHFDYFTKYANDIVLLMNREGRIVEVNDRALEAYGYTREELLELSENKLMLRDAEAKPGLDDSSSPLKDGIVFESIQLKKNGASFPAEISKRFLEINGEAFYQSIIRDITERKAVEESLLESEERYRKLVEFSPDTIAVHSSGKLAYINYSGVKLIGAKSPEELIGRNVLDFVHPDFREFTAKRFTGIFETKEPVGFAEEVFIKLDGTPVSVEVAANPISFRGRDAVQVYVRDLTWRNETIKALEESEEKFRKLVESANDAIFIADTNTGIIMEANLKAETLTGKTRVEIIGSHFSSMHPSKDVEKYEALFREGSTGKRITTGDETYVIHKDGHLIPVEISSSSFMLGGRKVIQGIFRDLSDRIKIESQVRKLFRAVEQSPSSIVITDTEGKIEYVNPKFTQLTGFSFEEAVNKKPSLLKSGETSEQIYKELWETITSGREWKGEFHNKKKNGELYWESASISPVRDGKGNITHFLAVKEDITAQKQITQELILAKERAEEADKLKSDFLAQMSHEIRTPLNVILSCTTLVRDELGGKVNDDIKSLFASIDASGKRLLRTINLILNMSALQSKSFYASTEVVDLSSLINKLVLEFEKLASYKSLELIFSTLTERTQVIADEYIVSEILQNIIDNAIKYTYKGKVEIILYVNKGGYVCVDVKDTGIGISENFLPKLFVPFMQEESGYSRKYEGNGLGLALVKNYAGLIDAEIKVASEKGKGSVFTVVFKNE